MVRTMSFLIHPRPSVLNPLPSSFDFGRLAYRCLRATVVSLYIKTDITSLPSVRKASTQILETFNNQHPSILVNNAGIGGGFGMLECEVERVRKVLDVNLISHWLVVGMAGIVLFWFLVLVTPQPTQGSSGIAHPSCPMRLPLTPLIDAPFCLLPPLTGSHAPSSYPPWSRPTRAMSSSWRV
jgi:hypothetical protein